MKILKITLQNIHSLKGRHIVDFTEGPLSKTGLFAITGPTGSGKSTLLDAITLALFNQTPRTGSLSKDAIIRLGAVITRNTDEAFAEIEYETKSKVYRSKWEISRARTGNLRDYNMQISFRDEKGEFEFFDLKKGDVPAKNAEIIGLNYDQFVKSILLSQGEFARFLRAKPEERGDLLEKITGTGIYRAIGRAAFEKQREEKQKLEQFGQKLKDIKILTTDEISIFNEQLGALNQKSLDAGNEHEVCGAGIKTKKDLKLKLDATAKLNGQLGLLTVEEEKLAPEKMRLKLHQLVLPLQSDLDKLTTLHDRKMKAGNEAESFKNRTSELEVELRNETKSLSSKTIEKENVKTLLTSQKPLFEEVLNLDKEIEASKTRKNDLSKRLGLVSLDEKNEAQKLDDARKTLAATDAKLESIKKFVDENPLLENISDTLPGLIENNRQLKEGLQIFEEGFKKEFPDLSKKMLQNLAISARQDFLAELIKNQETEILGLHVQIDGQEKDRQVVLQKIQESQDKIQVFEALIRQSEAWQKQKGQQETDELKLKEVETAFEKANNEEQQAIQKLEIIEKHIVELQARKEREALEAKYEEARAMLKPGEACPLCGSTSHPLVETYENKLSNTNQMLRIKTDEQKVHKLLKERYLREKTAAETEMKTITENIEKSNISIAETIESFEKTRQSANLNDLVIGNQNQLLEGRYEVAASLTTLKSVFEVIEKISRIEALLKGLRHFYSSLSQLCKTEENIKTGLQLYQKYLTGINETGKCLQELGRQHGFYKTAIEQNQAYRESKSTIVATISEKEKVVGKMKTEIAALTGLLVIEADSLTNLTVTRMEKFGEKDPVGEEKALDNLFHQIEKEEFEIRNTITKKTGELQNARQMATKAAKEIEEALSEILPINQRLLPELEKLGFQSPGEAQKTILKPQEAEAIIKNLDYYKDQITKTRQTLFDLSAEIESLKAIDDETVDLESLVIKNAELSEKINRLNQEIGAIKKELEQNAANLGLTAEIRREMAQQEKEFARWDALNRLIGDGTGKKFTGFAQELTLKFMLIKANLHLRNLTDRYKVTYEKSETVDDLFVIDTYHGDEKRSVKTLSGGESFQVSLALALGLSDLAGNKTRIESLFIDEGFGTLDQETLDTALSALEKLQHETNRTIGIISHVEALKDRITTQIELMKDASGNSKLIVK
jgi:exonuclease SbcC